MEDFKFVVDFEDGGSGEGSGLLIPKKEWITQPTMISFEKAELIKKRVKLLDKGYLSTVEDEIEKRGLTSSIEIALLEFDLGKLPPYTIKRIHGDGSYELWTHSDFKFFPK